MTVKDTTNALANKIGKSALLRLAEELKEDAPGGCRCTALEVAAELAAVAPVAAATGVNAEVLLALVYQREAARYPPPGEGPTTVLEAVREVAAKQKPPKGTPQ